MTRWEKHSQPFPNLCELNVLVQIRRIRLCLTAGTGISLPSRWLTVHRSPSHIALNKKNDTIIQWATEAHKYQLKYMIYLEKRRTATPNYTNHYILMSYEEKMAKEMNIFKEYTWNTAITTSSLQKTTCNTSRLYLYKLWFAYCTRQTAWKRRSALDSMKG